MELFNQSKRKTAYLTFDDGPSENTAKILQILDLYKIKATFFVVGNVPEQHLKLLTEMVNKGHGIGLHSYTHDYSFIYSSIENFKRDLDDLENIIKKYSGKVPSIYRFPGGSTNLVSKKYGSPEIMNELKKEIKNRGYDYFDWDIDSGDTKSYLVNFDKIIENVLTKTANREKAIILMHDAPVKTTTVQALPEMINGLLKQGFEFYTLS